MEKINEIRHDYHINSAHTSFNERATPNGPQFTVSGVVFLPSLKGRKAT